MGRPSEVKEALRFVCQYAYDKDFISFKKFKAIKKYLKQRKCNIDWFAGHEKESE